jgi:hypothetical protein
MSFELYIIFTPGYAFFIIVGHLIYRTVPSINADFFNQK